MDVCTVLREPGEAVIGVQQFLVVVVINNELPCAGKQRSD